jgi:hypothetical protein
MALYPDSSAVVTAVRTSPTPASQVPSPKSGISAPVFNLTDGRPKSGVVEVDIEEAIEELSVFKEVWRLALSRKCQLQIDLLFNANIEQLVA